MCLWGTLDGHQRITQDPSNHEDLASRQQCASARNGQVVPWFELLGVQLFGENGYRETAQLMGVPHFYDTYTHAFFMEIHLV